jgi:hypothetical protein
MHPDNSEQIDYIRAYIKAVETEVNNIGIIPRDMHTFAFDSVGLELMSKSFGLAKASLSLLDAGFPDEAYGLVRSLVEAAVNLRHLTQDLKDLDKRTNAFRDFEIAEKKYWLHYALEVHAGTPEEQEIKDQAKHLNIEPDTQAASQPWSGMKGLVWKTMAGDHPLDSPWLSKVPAYAVDYHLTSNYVHCSQPGLNNYFPQEGIPFMISPSTGKYGQPSQKVLFIVLTYLHSAICYALYGLNIDRSDELGKFFNETLSKMKPPV